MRDAPRIGSGSAYCGVDSPQDSPQDVPVDSPQEPLQERRTLTVVKVVKEVTKALQP